MARLVRAVDALAAEAWTAPRAPEAGAEETNAARLDAELGGLVRAMGAGELRRAIRRAAEGLAGAGAKLTDVVALRAMLDELVIRIDADVASGGAKTYRDALRRLADAEPAGPPEPRGS